MEVTLSAPPPGAEEDIKLAKAVPQLDLIIGGHSHTFFYTGTPPVLLPQQGNASNEAEYNYPYWVRNEVTGKPVPIVQAMWGSRWVQ